MKRIVLWLCAGVVACAGAREADRVYIEGSGTYPRKRGLVIDAPNANGAIIIKSSVSGVVIRNVSVLNAYRVIETAADTKVEGLNITDLTGENIKRDGIRLRDASNVTISKFDLEHAEEPSEGKHLPEGIAITAGKNIVIRDGRIRNFRMKKVKGAYTNGDGIATEGGVDGLLLERILVSDNSDGGFDLKGTNIQLRDLTSINDGRAFRIWSPSAKATRLTARNFRGAAIWLGKGASITIEKLTAEAKNPATVFRHESGASLIVRSCDLTRMPPGSKLVQPDGKARLIKLGAGCHLPG